MVAQTPPARTSRPVAATLRLSARSPAGFAWDGDPGEAPHLPERYAGMVWRRAVAYGVDLVIISCALAALWAIVTVLGILSFGLLSPLLTPALAMAPLAYHTVFVGGDRCATPGMRVLGLQARTVSGAPLSYGLAALWTIAFYVTVGLSSWLVLIVALFNQRHRTLHDYLCGVVVINLRTDPGVPQLA